MVVGLWFSAIVAYAQKVEEAGGQKENASVEKGSDDPIFKEMTPEDSISALKMAKKAAKRDWATWKPDPKRAMWLAIVLPGAGQIYNRKYWKLQIFYGGFVGCAYAMRWNNQMYSDYSQAYIDIMDDDPNTKSYESFLHLGLQIDDSNIEQFKTRFKSRKDRFRRWRDLSFFCMLGVYGLSIIDAYVDASLSQFDISDDLSLHVEPGFVGTTKTESRIKGNINPFPTTGICINAALTF
jgi:hypothetical protein